MNGIRSALVHWTPAADTGVALLTALLMIPVYYVGTHTHGMTSLLVFVIFGNGVLNVLFPAWYVMRIRREPASELGITTRRLWLAVLLSAICCLFAWKGLEREMASHPGVELLPQLIFNGVILWEPFFVFGWLQLRFERAFGIVPGVVLAAASFGAYHLGTYPLSGVVGLFVFGLVFATLFRITRNLIVLWPATWAVVSSIGTLQGNMRFGWSDVAIYAAILAVQVGVIAWMILLGRKKD
jgi:membrane protease YdiL (CAAX protease family)